MENLQEKIENYTKLGRELRKEIAIKIKEIVKENDGKIELDNYEDNEYMSIVFNGNIDSIIYDIHFENNDFKLKTENGELSLELLMPCEIIDLYEVLVNHTLPRIKREKALRKETEAE